MPHSDLTTSAQDLIKAVWAHAEWTGEPATASGLAERLGLRVSTVSDSLRRLSDQGLIDHARYGKVALTDSGRDVAIAMVRRHRLIETFLVEKLGYGWDEVHDEAEALEHVVSERLVSRIDEMLGFPTRDPHGDPIPSAEGVPHRPDALPLHEVSGPARVMVERISDRDPEMLQYFLARGIVVDAVLDVLPAEPFSEAVSIELATDDEAAETLRLGAAASSAVWVSPVPGDGGEPASAPEQTPA